MNFLIITAVMGVCLVSFIVFYILRFRYFRGLMGQLKMAEESQKKRLSQQELLSAISQSFISTEDTGTLIRNALMMIGMSMEVSRTTLAKLNKAAGILTFEYEWINGKHQVPPRPNRAIPFGPGESAYDTFIIRGDVYLTRGGQDSETLQPPPPPGINAFIQVPINVYGEFWGILSVEQCRHEQTWDESDIQMIRLIANVLTGLIIRADTEEELIRMSSIVNSSPSFIAWVTPQGQYKYINQGAAHVSGYSREELLEKGIAVLLDPEAVNKLTGEVLPQVHTRGYYETELPLKRKDGEIRTLSVLTFTTDSAESGFGVIAMDISERLRLEQELISAKELADQAKNMAEQSNRAKSNFLSRMSHEMRTPMNAIIGMTTIAQSSHEKEKMEYCLGKINEASLHLLGIINDILDMSKIESGKLDLSYSEFDFEKMLKRVTGAMGFRIDEKKQNFIVRIERDVPPRIVADEQRLSQVLINLLANAAKFTPEEGTITLGIKKTAGDGKSCTLRFDVVDSGIGISKEHMGNLFTLFEQGDGTIARRYGGTGLGLAISKSVVELMGGEIWVSSEPGKGSNFAFEITVERGIIPEETAPKKIFSWEKLRILVVDDSWEVLEYFKEYAEQMKINCVAASSGVEAYKMMADLDEIPFDIIFVDWRMPEMNGIELTEHIKSRFGSKAVVIMISAAEWGAIEGEAKKAGVDGFIPKPLFPSVLTDCINSCLKNMRGFNGGAMNGTDDFSGHTILLAEDVEINREIVLSLLEDTGIAIDCAVNGAEAVRLFTENPTKYDAIFMDIHMPEMDGYEATRRIRAWEKGERPKGVPIIAMTANVFKEDIEKCLAAGMNDHLGKPVDIEKLMAQLKKHLLDKDGEAGEKSAG